MKTIDVTHLIEPVTTSDYFKVIKVWDYDTFKDSILDAAELAEGCHERDYGVVLVLIDRYSDTLLLPAFHTSYFNQEGDKIDEQLYDEDLGHFCENHVTHNVLWTEDLRIEDNYRLQFIYTGRSCTQEDVKALTDCLESSCRELPVSWELLELNGED